MVEPSRAARESSGIAVEVAVGQQSLRQRREHDAAHPLPLRGSSSSSGSIQRLSIEYDGWWISSGVPRSRAILAASAGPRGGVRRDAGVQRPPGPHGLVERHHRLLDRRLGVEAVAVEDVDVVEAHPAQRLVERGEHVLAGAASLAVGARPHVVARLGRDDQLVAVGPEVLGQVATVVLLGATVGRPVVVGQVEVGHAAVEGPAQDRTLGLLRPVVAEVLPEPQAQQRQLQPAPAGVAVVVGVVAVLGGLERHAAILLSDRQTRFATTTRYSAQMPSPRASASSPSAARAASRARTRSEVSAMNLYVAMVGP